MNITQTLRRALQINANGIATHFKGRTHTWAQFSDRVSRLASGLYSIGLKRNDRVAILSLNSDRYFESLYACAWGSLIVVPLNIRLAAKELCFLLNDSETKVLLLDQAFLPLLDIFSGQLNSVTDIVLMEGGEPVLSEFNYYNYDDLLDQSEPVADQNADTDDVAGIYYTGGTTGLPKGVMLTHDNLVQNGLNAVNGFQFSKSCRYLHAAPMFHAADATANIAITLLGGSHYFVPKFEPEVTLQTMSEHGITNVTLVPMMINILAHSPAIKQYDLSKLDRISYGGAPAPQAVLEKAKAVIPHVKLTQAFGMTELSPIITVLGDEYHVTEGPLAGKIRSAGQVVLSGEIKIVDDDDTELPRGEIGEIIARGPMVMKGYWKRPEETAKAIVDGWMHTGDAGYMDEDGFVFVADRVKDMIISGGENIYSVEVENVLHSYPKVASCAVIGIPHEEWGEQVHAVVVLHEAGSCSEKELITFCKQEIAGYKCPRTVEFVSELPTSGAGKILKNKIRKPFWESHDKKVN